MALCFLKIAFNEGNEFVFVFSLQTNQNSTIKLLNPNVANEPSFQRNLHLIQGLPSEEEELIKWATETFGGVTSFTTLSNVGQITSTGTQGERHLCKGDFELIFITIIF